MKALMALLLALHAVRPPQEKAPRGEVPLPRGSSAPVRIAPGGDLWIGARDGHLWRSRDGARSWAEVATPAETGTRTGAGGDDLGALGFFTRDIGLLSIPRKGIWRTTDAGGSWTRLRDLSDGLLQVGEGCQGWLAVPDGGLLHSSDHGRTWTALPAPFAGTRKPGAFFMAAGGPGVVASDPGGGIFHPPPQTVVLSVTRNGGATWTEMAAPIEVEDDPWRHRVRKMRVVGEHVIVCQDATDRGGEVFLGDLSGGPWRPFEVAGEPVADFEVHGKGLALLTRSGGLVIVDAKLEGGVEQTTLPGFRALPGSEGGLSVRGDLLVVFDGRNRVILVERGTTREGQLATLAGQAVWNIQAVDRDVDGQLVGITDRTLYRSANGGRSWSEVAPLGSFAKSVLEVRSTEGGNILVWGRRHFGCVTPARGASLRPVPELDGLVVSQVRRYGKLWLVTGARVLDDDAYVKRTFGFPADWTGDWLVGVVLASPDDGTTWKTLTKWPGGLVASATLTRDGFLAAYQAGGGFRMGPLDTASSSAPWSIQVEAVLTTPQEHSLWSMYGETVFFEHRDVGFVQGNLHRGGAVRWTTKDGGRTWSCEEQPDNELVDYYRLGGGQDVRVKWDSDPVIVTVESGGVFSSSKALEGDFHQAHIDARGGLLVDLKMGEPWYLSPDGETWTRILRRER